DPQKANLVGRQIVLAEAELLDRGARSKLIGTTRGSFPSGEMTVPLTVEDHGAELANRRAIRVNPMAEGDEQVTVIDLDDVVPRDHPVSASPEPTHAMACGLQEPVIAGSGREAPGGAGRPFREVRPGGGWDGNDRGRQPESRVVLRGQDAGTRD